MTFEKNQTNFRIVVLGDSIGATCFSADKSYGFSGLLEARLNQTKIFGNRHVEVLNFCVNGYSTLQEARLLETRVVHYHPDLILIQYCLNDPCISQLPASFFVDPYPTFSYLLEFFLRATKINYKYKPDALPALEMGPDEGWSPNEYWRRVYRTDLRPWQSVIEGDEKILKIATEHSTPVIQVVFPLMPMATGKWDSDFRQTTHALLKETASRYHFHYLDLWPEFSKYSVHDIASDIYHPNWKGHQIAAEAIQKYMMENSKEWVQ